MPDFAPPPAKGKKFSVAKPARMGKKAAGTSMAKIAKPPSMSGGKSSMKGC